MIMPIFIPFPEPEEDLLLSMPNFLFIFSKYSSGSFQCRNPKMASSTNHGSANHFKDIRLFMSDFYF